MPELSAFTECGQLFLTSEAPLGERIYNAIWDDLGDNFARGGETDAKVYSWAMGLARAARGAQIVEEQIDPTTISDLLPSREYEYGLVPSATSSLTSRRGELAAHMLIQQGSTVGNVRQALISLLGADFVDYQLIDKATAVSIPSDPTTGPAIFALPNVARYAYTLANAFVGAPGPNVTLTLNALDVTQPYARIGDKVVVQPENPDVAERCTVVDFAGGGPVALMTVTMPTKAKDNGAYLVSQQYPYWLSNKRTARILVSASAAKDILKRAQINRLMEVLARTVSTWTIVSSLGPFVLSTSVALDDGSRLDTTCLTLV